MCNLLRFLDENWQTINMTNGLALIESPLISDRIDRQLMMMCEKANKPSVFNYKFIIAKPGAHNDEKD
jgi:hypothetical protein